MRKISRSFYIEQIWRRFEMIRLCRLIIRAKTLSVICDIGSVSCLFLLAKLFHQKNIRACLKNGSAGNLPAPVGDPPNGTAPNNMADRPSPLVRTVAFLPSSGSPDGTGGSPCATQNRFFRHALSILDSTIPIKNRVFPS